MNPSKPALILLLTTFPDVESARSAIAALLADRLIACGTLLPGAESHYRWNGALETSREVLVLLKTTPTIAAAVEQRLSALHPYQVPEILHLPVMDVAEKYLTWIHGEVSQQA